ncbi:hypothetical protein LX15_004777 [Streptoalloteichus tenebrarius]|uniref:Uncharacterized protein n=1 Tax=Streptoalloteichus tenebrarius (strain ATCC 17920 / DSM 40477 / JCM 4838 / CBS 697.72 / NBRC 16177 / NCIMB 11028 / NRRL B-12390 / A12253. 1 / ISP 5477) TaxID=1933 RepID=A0ABT1HZU7_STRSD|nr:hypothetical protein [Streptoalloteichus tenebrarius]MCP2261057.1 hypothetical protein [Streptoalloteichus tenebrarius]BFF03148.1 hypothetical protein GCM10020241_48230 [Streptoalloteichus tenebrarius]
MTRVDAIRAAAQVFAQARADRDALPPRLAAEAAWQAGGPSVEEIEAKIRALRGLATAVALPGAA